MTLYRRSSFCDLPFEIKAHIFSFCPIGGILNLRCCSKTNKIYVDAFLKHENFDFFKNLSSDSKRFSLLSLSQLKILNLVPRRITHSANELYHDEVSTLCKTFDAKLRIDSPEILRLSADAFFKIFQKALFLKDADLPKILISNPRFRRISFWNFSKAISLIVEKNNPDLLRRILDVSIVYEDEEISPVDEAFLKTCRWSLATMLKIISEHPRFNLIDRETLSYGFSEAAKYGREEIIEILTKHPRFVELSCNDLLLGLSETLQHQHADLLERLLFHPYFEQIPESDLKDLLDLAAICSSSALFTRLLADRQMRKVSFIPKLTSVTLFLTVTAVKKILGFYP